jgi:chaperonin cofactor prefoldin
MKFIFIPQLPQLSPNTYIHEVQIKMLKDKNKALNRRIDFLEQNQEAMSKEIKDLKKVVAAKIKKP